MKNRNRIVAIMLTIMATGMGCIHIVSNGSSISSNNISDNEIEVIELKEEAPSYNVIKRGDEESQFVVKQEVKQISENKIEVSKNEVAKVSENKGGELLQFPQLSDEDIYYLKKIATCESRYDRENMAMTMLVVLNRVKSPKFPNTIYEVIHQKVNGTYQFSVCRPGSTWYTTEPNEMSEEVFDELWDTLYDYSCGALYFNSYKDDKVAEDSWFGQNLEYLFKVNNTRYYK